jgi:anti-sigma28 factor (negative regulator of flagellin synthesis)
MEPEAGRFTLSQDDMSDANDEVISFSAAAIRTARIAKLRIAVETGTYVIDLDTLAARIIENRVVTILGPDGEPTR